MEILNETLSVRYVITPYKLLVKEAPTFPQCWDDRHLLPVAQLFMWVWQTEFGFSYLRGKPLTNWATAPAPVTVILIDAVWTGKFNMRMLTLEPSGKSDLANICREPPPLLFPDPLLPEGEFSRLSFSKQTSASASVCSHMLYQLNYQTDQPDRFPVINSFPGDPEALRHAHMVSNGLVAELMVCEGDRNTFGIRTNVGRGMLLL